MVGRHVVRTFKPRRRRLTDERSALMERLAPRWCLAECGAVVDPAREFGRSAPLVLEIGIGFGDALSTMAAADPSVDVIGCDVHTPGVAAALARIDERGLANVRLVHGDALVFSGRLRPGSLAAIRLYFPDPWPKARHRHRRMVTEDKIDRLARLLTAGGSLHVATDVADYALQTERVCAAHPELDGGLIDRPEWRPTTRYERKGLAAGRPIADLVFHRTLRDVSDTHRKVGASAAGGRRCGRVADDETVEA